MVARADWSAEARRVTSLLLTGKTKLRRLRRYVVLIASLLALWWLIMFSLQRWVLFPRHATQPDPNAGRGVPGLVRLSVPSEDGEVEGWLLPGHGATPERPSPAVIFAHGNAELIDHWPDEMEAYRRMGVSVLLPEYRGYGRSPGSPSQAAITEDFVRFYDLLAARAEVDRRRIVFHGRSLGGGAVCALAARRKPAALVLQSTFTSVVRMARRFLVPGFMVRDPFDNLEAVRGLDCPVLIVHGKRDQLIPYDHAVELNAAARRATLVTYAADHNDCPPDWSAFWDEVQRFLRGADILPARGR
jgi:pimeloyl-ACP methyl ester carboxylesterase